MRISKSVAIAKIKLATGLSIASSRSLVAQMTAFKDGKREKVLERDVNAAIRTANNPVQKPTGIKPISAKHLSRIQA